MKSRDKVYSAYAMIHTKISLDRLKKDFKNIYCFGAGKLFDSFIHEFAFLKLENNIKAIVDNNSNVIKLSKKMINNVGIPIISVKDLLSEIKEEDCILITIVAYEEIIDQLEKIETLRNIKFCIYSVARLEYYDQDRLYIAIPEKLSTCCEIQIPKVIHYCWFGKNEMPNQYKKYIESWKHYCPDYEIIEWNEMNYDVHKSKYISQAYEAGKWAFVSDYARIDIINEYGGVYLDTDVELIKNIDVMLMNEAFCGFERREYVNYGLGFGAKKSNAILNEIKDYYDHMSFILSDGTLNLTVCPLIQTEIMKKHGLCCNGDFQIVDGMAVYPSRVFCGMSPHSFRMDRSFVYTYLIHHFEASWMDDLKWKSKLIMDMKKWGCNDNYIYSDL